MHNSMHAQVPRLSVSSAERGYTEHIKCFKQCLKGFQTASLSQDERSCVIGCLGKYKEAQRYLSEKVHRIMVEHATQNPDITKLYDNNADKSQ